jgi:hypothetical protein
MRHVDYRHHLGGYVANALEPHENHIVDDHLDVCEQCRQLFLELSEVSAVLARVQPVGAFARPIRSPDPDPRRADAGLRRKRRWPYTVVPAIAFVLMAAATGGAVAASLDAGRTARNGVPTLAGSPTAWPARIFTGQNPATGVSAVIALTPKPFGVDVDLRVSGAPPGLRCRLLVVPRGGAAEAESAWATPTQTPGDITALHTSASIPIDDIIRLEIVTTEGVLLLAVPT